MFTREIERSACTQREESHSHHKNELSCNTYRHCRRINKPIKEHASLAGAHGRWHFARGEPKIVEKVVKANKKGDAGRRALDEIADIQKQK